MASELVPSANRQRAEAVTGRVYVFTFLEVEWSQAQSIGSFNFQHTKRRVNTCLQS